MRQISAGVLLALCGIVSSQSLVCSPDGAGSLYDFSAPLLDGSGTVQFSDYDGKQEPGANATEIYNALEFVRPGNGFVPNFQLFKKIEVNGANEIPLYTFLK
ncbi:unnamed protein product, partial [Notodromas monacha]